MLMRIIIIILGKTIFNLRNESPISKRKRDKRIENNSYNTGNPLLDRDNSENVKPQPSQYLAHYKQSDSQKFDIVKELKNGTNKVKDVVNSKYLPHKENTINYVRINC